MILPPSCSVSVRYSTSPSLRFLARLHGRMPFGNRAPAAELRPQRFLLFLDLGLVDPGPRASCPTSGSRPLRPPRAATNAADSSNSGNRQSHRSLPERAVGPRLLARRIDGEVIHCNHWVAKVRGVLRRLRQPKPAARREFPPARGSSQSGRASRCSDPCTESHPSPRTAASCSSVSTPSAVTAETEAVRKHDNGAHDLQRALVVGDVAHEGVIDLDAVEREAPQIAERGVSGAEVVGAARLVGALHD